MTTLRFSWMFLLLASSGALSAQTSVACPERAPSGAIGIGRLDCVGESCQVNTRDKRGQHFHSFSVEPVIGALNADAAKEIRVGDVIIAIDDLPITTRKAGYALANLEVGRSTALRIRRDGRELMINVVPRLGCNMPMIWVRSR
jgi:C-terminal processing protease CtpA/Prc